MAENGFSFLKDILFTPASVRAQNNQANLLREQSAISGANMSGIAQEIMTIRERNPNIQPNQLIMQLTKSPKFINALSGSDETWKQAMELIQQTQAPAPAPPVKVGQFDTLQVPGQNGQFEVVGRGSGVDQQGNQQVSTDKIANFKFLQSLPPEQQAQFDAFAKSDNPSDKEQMIADLQKIGWSEENAIKYARGVYQKVENRDPITGATTVSWLDVTDPKNPQLFNVPEQSVPSGGIPGAPQAAPAPQAAQPTSGAGSGGGEIPAEGVTLLNAIAGTESPGYDVMNGGQRFADMSQHPLRKGQAAKGGTTSASGRYQFVRATWERAAKALGLTDFSPVSQDRAAWWLAQQDYKANTGRDLLGDLRAGNIDLIRNGLGSTWRGLVDNPKKFNAAMGRTGGTTGAENFQPQAGAAGLNQAQDINGGRPSGRRLAEAFLTVGPVGAGSRMLETGSQILDPSASTPQGTRANEDQTMRAQLASNIRAMQADLGRGNNVSKYEAEQFNETIAKIDGATSAQAALANVKQAISTAEQSRDQAKRILSDPTQSIEERKAAQQRLNVYNDRLAQLPSVEDIDAVLEDVRGGKSGASTLGGLIKQGQATLDTAVPAVKGVVSDAETAAAPLVAPTGLDPNAVPKMTLQDLLKVQRDLQANGQDFRDLPPELQQTIRARIQQLQGGGK